MVAPDSSFKSTRSRAERKAETRLAAENHEIAPPGNAAALKVDDYRTLRSTKTIEDRKAETRLAIKQHQLTPAGEGQDAPRK